MLRSSEWFDRPDEIGLQNRAVLRQAGLDPDRCSGKPVIGIANTWSDLNPCNLGLRALAVHVRRGIEEAGGVAMEFHALSLGEELMKPSAMLYRNLLAMEVEEALRSYPLDGIVCLGGCDKTLPAQLMAVASADLPAIFLNAGPKLTTAFRGELIGSGTALWKYADERRLGRIDDASWAALESAYAGTVGTCNVMGTASTMAALVETLGLLLPGVSALPATDPLRLDAAVRTGATAVALVRDDLRPSRLLTPAAFENALHAYFALGGSTNCILHLLAIARRRRMPLSLADFDRVARETPVLVDLQPAGAHLMAEFARDGGVPALLHALGDRIDTSALTVTGRPWGEELRAPATGGVVHTIENPVQCAPGLAILKGSLAPDGAVLRLSTASPHLFKHTGPAIVFKDYDDMLARIDSPDLPANADSILVLQNAGACGVPGLPEWGNLPIPSKLLRAGITDMVRISDSRMSGTAHGTVILHTAPESAKGGPISLVLDGDLISLDVENRRIDLLVSESELTRRRAAWTPPASPHLRGWPRLYQSHVLGPEDGCDFDFLVPDTDDALCFVPPRVGRS